MDDFFKIAFVIINCIVWVALSPVWIGAYFNIQSILGLMIIIAIVTFITIPLAVYIGNKILDKIL